MARKPGNDLVFHQTAADFLALCAAGDVGEALTLVPTRPSRGFRPALEKALALVGADGVPSVHGKARKTLQARLRAIPAVLYDGDVKHTCTGCGWVGFASDFGPRWNRQTATVDPDEWEEMAHEVLEIATDRTRDRVLASLTEQADGWTAEVPTVQNACPTCRKEAARAYREGR